MHVPGWPPHPRNGHRGEESSLEVRKRLTCTCSPSMVNAHIVRSWGELGLGHSGQVDAVGLAHGMHNPLQWQCTTEQAKKERI